MNKLVVVSGGTKGIGRAILDTFVKNGFDVFTCARTEKDLIELKLQLASLNPASEIHTCVADMSRRKDIDAFTKAILDLNRPVEVLVNNAGYFVPGKITEEQEGTLEKMMDANLFSAYHLTRTLVPGMKAAASGHIFNMCSIASIIAYPNGGAYSITKFALLGFSKVLREELKPSGIRVTAVIAGATRTASWDGSDLPEERFMSPQDVADSVFGAYSLSKRSVVEELILRPQLGDI